MSGCWGNQNALREQDIQSISWLGVGVFGAGQICLREWDIQRAVRVWGGSKRLREWDIRWAAGQGAGEKRCGWYDKNEVWAA